MGYRTMEKRKRWPSLLEMLLILFVGLKLLGYISWSWWWVTSPIWIPLALAIALIMVYIIKGGTLEVLKSKVAGQTSTRSAENPHPVRRIDPVVIHRSNDTGANDDKE